MPQLGENWQSTRASLLLRCRDLADQTSWREFFERYAKLIYAVARKAGLSDAEAQDAVQETMFSAAKQLPDFVYDPALGSFKGWLLNLTRWRITDQFRQRRRHVEPAPADAASDTRAIECVADPASLNVDQAWTDEWEKHLLDTAVTRVKSRLEPRQYQLFDFYVHKEWPPEKVARSFGVSVNQVYLANHRITELIKTEVQRLGREIV